MFFREFSWYLWGLFFVVGYILVIGFILGWVRGKVGVWFGDFWGILGFYLEFGVWEVRNK